MKILLQAVLNRFAINLVVLISKVSSWTRTKFKVFRSVVCRIFINVMNHLPSFKFSAKFFRHYLPMNKNFFLIYIPSKIFSIVVKAFIIMWHLPLMAFRQVSGWYAKFVCPLSKRTSIYSSFFRDRIKRFSLSNIFFVKPFFVSVNKLIHKYILASYERKINHV